MTEQISVEQLVLDSRTQIRAHTDERVVRQYAEVLESGGELPAITVFFDGEHYVVADGFLRLAAWQKCGRDTVPCEVHIGSRRDAILFAAGANATHGLPRSNADKRRAVETVLAYAEWSGNADRWVAEVCAVSHTLVRRVRASLVPGKSTEESAPRTSSSHSSKEENAPSTSSARGIGFHVTDTPVDENAHKDELVEVHHIAETPSGGIGFHLDVAVEPEPVETSDQPTERNKVQTDVEQHTSTGEESELELVAENTASDARAMRRGRDGKMYPVRIGPSVVAVAEPNVAKRASDEHREKLAGRVLDPLLRILGDRIAEGSLYALEKFALLSPVDQLIALSFLVGGRVETLDEAIRIERGAEVNAAIESERVPLKVSADVPTIDPCGREIPEHVAPAMAEVPVLSALLSDIRRARRRWSGLVTRYESNPVPRMSPLLWRARDEVEQSLRKAERALLGAAIPHAVCGYCKARGSCTMCRGAGWLGKEAHASVPRRVSSSPLTAEEMGWWLGSQRRMGSDNQLPQIDRREETR